MKNPLLALALAAGLIQTPAIAGTEAKEKQEVEAAFASWREAIASRNAEKIVQLYDPEAVLLSTLSAKPITTQQDRTAYFTGLAAKPGLAVQLTEQHLRLLDEDDAVVSGLYTFSFTENGKLVTIPARFSFVYEKEDGQWKIVEHHSSKVPQ